MGTVSLRFLSAFLIMIGLAMICEALNANPRIIDCIASLTCDSIANGGGLYALLETWIITILVRRTETYLFRCLVGITSTFFLNTLLHFTPCFHPHKLPLYTLAVYTKPNMP